jgi:phosphatidylglycerol---prolipoprotein diacylglyceryl transferase
MREGLQIGPFIIHYYGVIIMLGALIAAWMTSRQAEAHNDNPDLIWDMLPWLLVAGIIGARIWHILFPPLSMVEIGIDTKYYLTHPLDAIMIWKGGLGIPGAVIAGLLALIWYARKHKLDFRKWADYIAPGLAVAQAIGRWGNYINQEVYGAPTNLPWKIFIDPAHRIPGYMDQAYYHPLFLYESLYNLANMGILIWVSRAYKDKIKPGDVILTYAVIYPLGRFFLEFLRLDSANVLSLNVNQAFMGIVAIIAAAALFYRHRMPQAIEATGSVQEENEANDSDTDENNL